MGRKFDPKATTGDYPIQDQRAGLPSESIGGRFMTTYDPNIALRIVERMAEGETMTSVCTGKEGFPHRDTFRRWMVNHPDLARAVEAARIISAGSFEEEALEAARDIRRNPKDGTNVRATEVYINQLRWSAERRDPSKYGARQQVSVRVPIQINTTLDLGSASIGAGTAEHPDIYKLEAKVAKPIVDIEETNEPLVKGRPIVPEWRGKKRNLVAPSTGRPMSRTPFTKIARGLDEEHKEE